MIRQATIEDASRIAEISIFTKRMNYRSIFHNDKVSFREMQVYPLADSYIHDPQQLQGIWVFDDEFVKGFINIDGKRIAELYVDSFFENQGIGSRLLSFAVTKGCNALWVLEKNTDAQRFYSKHGFVKTGERKLEEGTEEYITLVNKPRQTMQSVLYYRHGYDTSFEGFSGNQEDHQGAGHSPA